VTPETPDPAHHLSVQQLGKETLKHSSVLKTSCPHLGVRRSISALVAIRYSAGFVTGHNLARNRGKSPLTCKGRCQQGVVMLYAAIVANHQHGFPDSSVARSSGLLIAGWHPQAGTGPGRLRPAHLPCGKSCARWPNCRPGPTTAVSRHPPRPLPAEPAIGPARLCAACQPTTEGPYNVGALR
jgi:hypothetical protein